MGMVFVSYARVDKVVVKKIMTQLHESGFDYWMDTRNIPGGTRWMEEITHGIKTCKVFLLFMSVASMSSENVQREVSLALENKKHIVILRLETVDIPSEFSYPLTGINWIDYSAPNWLAQLVVALKTPPRRRRRAARPEISNPGKKNRKKTPSMQGVKIIIQKLQSFFSRGGEYFYDESTPQLGSLIRLRNEINRQWDQAPEDFQQLTSKIYLLDKVTTITNLVREFQGTCPPGAEDKRQAIRRELEHLINDLSIK